MSDQAIVPDRQQQLPIYAKGHISSAIRFLRQGLPRTGIDNDQARLVIGFYCLATLDILDALESASSESEKEGWRSWIWAQQIRGIWGSGFRGSPGAATNQPASSEYDPPFLIMTYAALLSLAILRDPLTQLDREGLRKYLKISQREDGSFKLFPTSEEYDLRMTYCAFSICSMLDDWSSINIPSAVTFIQSCRTYEGGYGQEPNNEAHGGSTYCALASLHLVPPSSNYAGSSALLTPAQHAQTTRWLLHCQEAGETGGGFAGRTNKVQDACYCFWCGASLDILGMAQTVNADANASFLLECQFRFGGIRKDRVSNPDPYHTYLALASLNILSKDTTNPLFEEALDPLWNARASTQLWLKQRLHATPATAAPA